MNSLIQLLLFSFVVFSLTLSIQGSCTTCGGTVLRTVTLVSGTGTAFPCWLQNTNDLLPKCYLCSSGTDGTRLSDLLGPAGNIASCNGTNCLYMTSTYTGAATLHPCWNAEFPCSDPGSCSYAQHAKWSWPSPVDVTCSCSQRRREAKVETKQIDPNLCPWGSIVPLTIPCQNISHSTYCPYNPLNGLGALSNDTHGGNCLLCDSGSKCFSNASSYQQNNNTCSLVGVYGNVTEGTVTVPHGLNVPCMDCHGILLTNGTTICGTHVSKTDLCYCNVLSLDSCSNVTITGQPTQKICGVWDMDDAVNVACLAGGYGWVHIASLDECQKGLAYPPTNCDAHQCSGATC